MELPIKSTPFTSLSPFYRFYSQTQVDYFAPNGEHTSSEKYYTSDYDLPKFTSHYFGAGIPLASPKGILSIQKLNSVELRYGH